MITRRQLLSGAASVAALALVQPVRAAGLFGAFNGLIGGGQYLMRANLQGPTTAPDPSIYYNPAPGVGDPAISTADYYLSNGCYWFRCYDLDTMGTPGATVKAANNGNRYVWLNSADHPNTSQSWQDSWSFGVGFSNDPGVPPDKFNIIIWWNNSISVTGNTTFQQYHAPYLFYNPDDATYPFYIYSEASSVELQHEEGLTRSTDLTLANSVQYGPTHVTPGFSAWSSFQRVWRNGPGDFASFGLSWQGSSPGSYGGFGVFTSTDALSFTKSTTNVHDVVGNSSFIYAGSDLVNIGGQNYALATEALYNQPPYGGQLYAVGAMAAGTIRLAQYVSLVPVDASFNGLSSPAVIRISEAHTGLYPGPTYLQVVVGYQEDGLLHAWALRGFYTSAANLFTASGKPFMLAGGLNQELVDYYVYPYDATLAVAAAPVGVVASCAAGVVTVSWYDALPNNTYRVYKGTSSGTQATLVGDVAGTSITDSPTPGQQWWYKVVTLESGTERKNRVVHVYASANSALANKHVNRVIDDGGDPTTINQTWLQTCIDWAVAHDLDNAIEFWADAAFGVKLSAGKVVKVYCLGTTILPRGGDLTMATANVTYSATGLNSTAPAWTNPAATDRAYFGGERVNNIRQKTQATMFAAYKKPDTNKASFICSAVGASDGIGIEHVAGTPGNANFFCTDATHKVSATATLASATGVNVVIGFFDGTNVVCYGNGTAGTPQSGLDPNLLIENDTALRGPLNSNQTPYPKLTSGCSTTQCSATNVPTYQRSEAKFTASCVGFFAKGMTAAQAISFDAMQATHIGR
jgi:hypothetical protein